MNNPEHAAASPPVRVPPWEDEPGDARTPPLFDVPDTATKETNR